MGVAYNRLFTTSTWLVTQLLNVHTRRRLASAADGFSRSDQCVLSERGCLNPEASAQLSGKSLREAGMPASMHKLPLLIHTL
jgi:hypothetical protein